MTDDPKDGVTAPPSPTLTEMEDVLADYTTTVQAGIVDGERILEHISTLIADRDQLAAALREKEAECDRLGQSVKELESFARHIRDSYDHDSDAHKYGTACRVCEADLLLARAQEGKADA